MKGAKMSNKTSDKLLSCPFCGGEAEINLFMGNYCVTCKECAGAIFPYFGMTKEEAITAWNTRKPLERIVERLEELTEKHMSNSEKAAELGKDYERHMILNGAKGIAFEAAIEIVKEEGGFIE